MKEYWRCLHDPITIAGVGATPTGSLEEEHERYDRKVGHWKGETFAAYLLDEARARPTADPSEADRDRAVDHRPAERAADRHGVVDRGGVVRSCELVGQLRFSGGQSALDQELSVILMPRHRDEGLTVDVLAAAATWAFEEKRPLPLECIHAKTALFNHRMVAVAAVAGARLGLWADFWPWAPGLERRRIPAALITYGAEDWWLAGGSASDRGELRREYSALARELGEIAENWQTSDGSPETLDSVVETYVARIEDHCRYAFRPLRVR